MDQPRSVLEETTTQVQAAFTDALEQEGLLEAAFERAEQLAQRVDPDLDDGISPVMLAVSDNGSQMIAGGTRKFMAMVAIAQHFGRPSTPTDQAWIESLNGTIKAEWPHLLAITDPTCSGPNSTSSEPNTTGHVCIQGSDMSLPTTNTKAEETPSEPPAEKASNELLTGALASTKNNATIHITTKTQNSELRTQNSELRTQNSELRTQNSELENDG